MAGRCEKRQDLADTPLELCAAVTMLPCRGDRALLDMVFEPLGYEVKFTSAELDEAFPDWGQSRYVNLSLKGKTRLRDLLRHLYVLIPVFDRQKHYWIGEDEIDKLIQHGEGWLDTHPAKAFIAQRYFKQITRLSRMALNRLDNGEGGAINGGAVTSGAINDGTGSGGTVSVDDRSRGVVTSGAISDGARIGGAVSIDDRSRVVVIDGVINDSATSDELEAATLEPVPIVPLNTRRLEAVVAALKDNNAQSVIDMGCGEGNLLQLLLADKFFTRVAGTDVSLAALSHIAERTECLPAAKKQRLTLFQSSVSYRDKRFAGYDAAALVEVIEHLDENRLNTVAAVLFGEARPAALVITTPNIEYNENYPTLAKGRFRHGDHRFEWTREQFRAWADITAKRYGYKVRYEDIGNRDERLGAPTQMGVFTRCE
jgi:2-polyprenyl-3-methyl-5-hydroxy-6-metoxy-1,4-benzoquinol methylase